MESARREVTVLAAGNRGGKTRSTELAYAAYDYLTIGLGVIALSGKTPNTDLHRTGLHSALRGAPEGQEDWDLIDRFFRHPETTGVGILVEFPYVVVDIDGEDGAAQWLDLLHETQPSWDVSEVSWVAKTGRGLHLWYASMEPTGSIKLGPRLDLKGAGGYVAAPPSRHPDGPIYEWLRAPSPEVPPVEVPEALARRIRIHNSDVEARMQNKDLRKVKRNPRYAVGDHVFYAQVGYDALIRAVRESEEGNRNNMLHWAAATMRDEGGITEDFDELAAAALDIGLDPVEVKRTIQSARRG